MATVIFLVLVVLLQVLGLFSGFGSGDVYVILMEDDPVVSYQGSIQNFPATAVPPGSKLDVTREHVQLYKNYLTERHDRLLQRTLQDGTYRKLYSYHHLLNGFAVETNSEEAVDLLWGAEGVRHIEKDWKLQKMTTYTPEFLGISTEVWPKLGGARHSGEGVVMGVVDTGINPVHPSFSNATQYQSDQHYSSNFKRNRKQSFTGKCEVAEEFPIGSCNGKIIGAQHFCKAAIAAGDFNATQDYASPFDANGHGSHTASTAAGNHRVPVMVKGFNYGYASGMAPAAQIAVYKALYSFGGYMADVVAAIDQAVQDGVDILNLSIGPSSIPEGVSAFLNLLEIELLFAVRAGVFVVQAAGNGGPSSNSVLSFSPWITTVAASFTDRRYNNSIKLGNGQIFAGNGLSPPTQGKSYYKMVSALDVYYHNTSYVEINTCQHPEAFKKHMVEGNILLCTYSFEFEFESATILGVADTAMKLGAAGFVLAMDPDIGLMESTKSLSITLEIPGIIITDVQSSSALMDYYNATTRHSENGTVVQFGGTAKIGDGRVATFSGNGPIVASYSSRGPDVNNANKQAADVLKPNIMAPGNLIWAAWSPRTGNEQTFEGQNFTLTSGTSMATPHVAGVAAMIKEKHPEWSPAAITSALMTTAYRKDRHGKPILAQSPLTNDSATIGLASPFDYGAGAINPDGAIDPGLIFDADFQEYVDFLCSVPGVDEASVRRAVGVTCSSTIPWSSELNTPSITVSNLIGSRDVHRTMKNVAATETYNASIIEPDGVEVSIWPEMFTIHNGSSRSFTVVLKATKAMSTFTFGQIKLTGDKGHVVRIPLSICASSVLGG